MKWPCLPHLVTIGLPEQVALSLVEGDNDVVLLATDLHGEVVGEDRVTITWDGGP